MRRSRLLLLLLPREPASCWKGKGGGRALGDGGDPAGDGVPLGKSWGAPTEHLCCYRVGWGLGGLHQVPGTGHIGPAEGFRGSFVPHSSPAPPARTTPSSGGGPLVTPGGPLAGAASWEFGDKVGAAGSRPFLISSPPRAAPVQPPPGRRGRSQGDRSRHKGRPPGSPRRAHQGSLCVPGSALITSPPSSRGVTLRAQLCQTIKHARLTQIPPGSLGKRRPRGFGEEGGGTAGRAAPRHPAPRGFRFVPPPSPLFSPPTASPLCGLISLSKWHNPPGNLLVTCERRGENH